MAQEKWEILDGGAGVDDDDFQFGIVRLSRTTHVEISHSISRRRRSGRPGTRACAT